MSFYHSHIISTGKSAVQHINFSTCGYSIDLFRTEDKKLVGAQFLPGILDANLCKNKQTNNKLTNIEQITCAFVYSIIKVLIYTWYLFYLFVFVYFCIN